MAKGTSFGAERALAVMFAASALMLLAIPVVGRVAGRHNLDTGDTRAERAESRKREEQRQDNIGLILKVLSFGGTTGIVVSLATGLVIAFGVGPSWMAALKVGMTVQDTFADDGENKYFGRKAPDLPGVRYYVRVRHPDGKVGEFHTDRATYQKISVGQVLDARLLGRRLVKIEKATEPGDV